MMNVFWFILLASAGVVVLALGIDVGQQIWVEKRAERKAQWAKIREAEAMLYAGLAKRLEARRVAEEMSTAIELNVVSLPKKPVGGRHRLTAA